ncbi:quaternary amine ABC transporter ATP-binding protein [Paradevosia shaoguanensis]|uniref:Quaternary amine transport ATP-binding protein n=1 Tax=Paradevosia shaoguanensis TaxID=1335043 RepID=A0AA41QKF7_9HYPH|nr:betaine/proline/choline family ABC transporter ATP-binding protein [Paradevosia shaoguanensis]KFL26927.1 glycine/betaine ABC transporter [Devosia sp. 17-2-E-8]MCF1742034.1 betaine/proline/choline family ABC transporter ATP-binding protein [Paradevosia shaoguanensis]MCI0126517.1 betaine/proline/choline family ABC transporter ATP-binding protein [Paradevosia shaoguanensis]
MTSENAITMRGVTKIFGDNPQTALELLRQGRSKTEVQAETGQIVGLDEVSLDIERGQIFVVMGLSGSGKSTLIRHVNRLIEPTAGSIVVDGRDVLTMNRDELRDYRRASVAMVFQKFALLPHRSVIDNVAYGLEIRGADRRKRLAEAEKWIETVGLAGYEQARPRQLSGGQQQRVGLARALAMDTDIVLMDEAFSALDPLIRSGMQDQLIDLQKSLNKTILFITHDFDEALKIGNRIAVLKDGAVQQVGKPEDIVLRPANEHIEQFVREVNKARAIHVRSIMEVGNTEPCEQAVSMDARCEDVLPLFADHKWVGVVDEEGKQIGRVTARQVITALARYTPQRESEAA